MAQTETSNRNDLEMKDDYTKRLEQAVIAIWKLDGRHSYPDKEAIAAGVEIIKVVIGKEEA